MTKSLTLIALTIALFSCKKDQSTSVCNGKAVCNLEVDPNPTQGETDLKFYSEESAKIKIELMDISGKMINSLDKTTAHGANKVTLDLTDLDNDTYLIYVKSGDESHSLEIIKN